jgi:hypothetical protein
MPLFASKREKRFWFGVLAVVAAIYSALGLAGEFETYLREHNLLSVSFMLGFFMVIIVIVGVGLK